MHHLLLANERIMPMYLNSNRFLRSKHVLGHNRGFRYLNQSLGQPILLVQLCISHLIGRSIQPQMGEVNYWPSISGNETYVSIEYEASPSFDLRNVVISVPLLSLRDAPQVDGEWMLEI